jgi:hypothetical protein
MAQYPTVYTNTGDDDKDGGLGIDLNMDDENPMLGDSDSADDEEPKAEGQSDHALESK